MNGVVRFGSANINVPRPNESTHNDGVRTPRVVRVIRTLRPRVPATAQAWMLRTDTGASMPQGLSLRIVAFFIDHPILAMLTLCLAAVIGFVCIFELPIRWAPF
jgi:hypothetical protein